MKVVLGLVAIILLLGVLVAIRLAATVIAEEELDKMPDGPKKDRVRAEMLAAMHSDQQFF